MKCEICGHLTATFLLKFPPGGIASDMVEMATCFRCEGELTQTMLVGRYFVEAMPQ